MEPQIKILIQKFINKMTFRKWFILSIFTLFFLIATYFVLPPKNFPTGIVVTISKGDSMLKISNELESLGIVRSKLVFQSVAVALGGSRNISTGDYLFEKRISSLEVSRRIAFGVHHVAPIKVTLPEGKNNSEMAEIFSGKIALFSKEDFLNEASSKQGYLFPDTYFFYPHTTTLEIIDILNTNFQKHIALLKKEIIESKRTENQIITMASILEKEASGEIDMAVISGILWRRFDIGMKLQVDATMGMDFDTYKTVGLPPTPISNPGIMAIKYAIHPKSSPYLYYLHDKSGVVHYASTYLEHRKNIAKYLH